jgi:hypothetical protein
MNFQNVALAAAVATALGMTPVAGHAQQATEYGQIKWFGSIYGKFLDGNRRYEGGLFSNAESTPGFAGGDQGQGMELELMMNSQISKQVEIGARIHSRFYGNYWSNFGGFGPAEDDPRTNQYIKLRGAWVRLTPGYDWVDSVTIGNSDFGMFDPWTQGKYRYIDRDNAGGFLFQGSALNRQLTWDFARVTLASFFQGVAFNTGDLVANDANYVGQLKYAPSPDWNATLIGMYARDKEVDEDDSNPFNGFGTSTRYDNAVVGVRGQYSGLGFVDIRGTYYYSNLNVQEGVCDTNSLESCRFSPLLKADASDDAWTLNFDFNRVFMDGLSLNVQLFDIGADYQSITAARREADVLLTEGPEGSWQWGLPDYNTGSRTGPGSFGVGYGGWNGEVQQVVSLMPDNDFADFDESYVHSVLGWKGVTVVPRLLLGDWEFSGEYSWIDFNTAWQACGGQDKDVNCIYPRNEGTHSWGLGGDWRSPYAPYQDRELEIFALKAKYTLDVGKGVDLMARYKFVADEDNRVTRASGLIDAYDGFPIAAGAGLNPDWIPNIGLGGCLSCDDRRADFDTYSVGAGYQLTPDLYARLIYEFHQVELIDGTIDVAPVGLGFEGAPGSYVEYLTGEHEKNRLGLEFTYFLAGVNFGGSFDYFWGEYDPVFYTDLDGRRVRMLPAAGVDSFATALGNISTNTTDLGQYRMKVWMKVGF